MLTKTDEQQITDTVNNYVEGIRESDGARVAKAFYSTVNLSSLNADGALQLTPKDALVELADSGTLPPNSSDILLIEIINDMALVKVKIDLPTLNFFDYLTLLRLETVGWKIVSKTYTAIMK